MRDAARTARIAARGDPGATIELNWAAGTVEHPRHNNARLALKDGSCCPLLLEQIPQLWQGGEGERTSIAVLRRAGIESNDAGAQINLMPLQRQDLAVDAPTGEVAERNDGLYLGWQPAANGLELLALEESAADVVLLQHRNVWSDHQLSGLAGEREPALQRRELAVDGAVRGAIGLSLRDVSANIGGCEARHTTAHKPGPQALVEPDSQPDDRAPTIGEIFVLEVRGRIVERETANSGEMGTPLATSPSRSFKRRSASPRRFDRVDSSCRFPAR